MKKKITIEENHMIEINGVLLTPEVIKQIKSFQENENELIRQFKEYIAEAICFMSKEVVDYSGLDKESRTKYLLTLTANLSYSRDYLTELERPC